MPYTPPTSTPSAAAATISVAERAGVQPISALNPYQKNVSSQAPRGADCCRSCGCAAVAVQQWLCSSGCVGLWDV